MAATLVADTAENTSALHIIGKGARGTVWASSEKGSAFKREDGGPARSLRNDFDMHHQLLRSFQELKEFDTSRQIHLRIQIPACYGFIESTDQKWWSANQRRFPPGYLPCNILHSQRILPFSEPVRRILIDNYCPPDIARGIIVSEANKDCLIRSYLSRRRTQRPQTTSRFTAFSLRNYPLHIEMESLGITTSDTQQYAKVIAETLAMMHWEVEIDGNDIEFVLAPLHEDQSEQSTGLQTESNILGNHAIWVLDFDLRGRMTMDMEGVRQAVAAFWGNDPYYPRPDRDLPLWNVFREHYIQMSEVCTAIREPQAAEQRRALSREFVELVEEGGRDRKKPASP